MADTLADMKARIADEIDRDDLTSQIALAISDTIKHYQTERFFTNEGTLSFSTVASQQDYGTSTAVQLANLFDVDDMFVLIPPNQYRVRRIDPTNFTILSNSYTLGQPFRYQYFNRTLSLYPIPDRVYSMTLHGMMTIAEPATDAETGNSWMIEAERLIRAGAKRRLHSDITKDWEQADRCAAMEAEALIQIRAATSNMTRNGAIEPMEF